MSIFWIILLVSISGTKHAEEECESDLVERMPALEGPFSALHTLQLTNTSFVNCINDPPGPAKLGMENVKKRPERKPDSTGSGSSKMVARDLKFLDSLKTSDKENFLPAVMKRSREKLWTFSQVDFQPAFIEPAVSSACKGLCQGVGSMEAYDRVAKVVAPKHQELRKEEGLLTLLMQKLNTDRDELKKVIDRLRDLNNELESLNNRKKELENNIEEGSQKLERAEKMSLGGKEDWGTEAASYNLSIIEVSDSTYVRTLENAIQFGTLVLLENIGEEELGALSEPVLLMATFKQEGVEYRRLRENVIEYSSNFKFLLNGFLVEYYLEESDHVTKEPLSLLMLKQVDFMEICICFHYLPYLLQAQYYEQRLRENVIEYSSNVKFLLNGFQVEYYLEESDHVTKEPMSLVMLKQVDFMEICICFHYLLYPLQDQYYEQRLRENVLEYSSNFKFLLNGFQVEYYLEEFDQVTKAPLTALQPTWIQTSAETEKMVVLLEKVTTEVSDAKEQLVGADEKEANEAAAIAQGIQEECEGDLAEAMPALDSPLLALHTLNLANISFFKPMPDPNGPVTLAMESVKEGVRAVEEHDRAANVVAPKHEQLREAEGLLPLRMNETTHSGEE
uniref:dynein heavy chain 3, axonemal-like n=1 Tax=Podarcis muralis TaxID=64176 RepID=UPI00109F4225|nr:dynein heavy chain 3, axonemal-like [Podarcis muralis]